SDLLRNLPEEIGAPVFAGGLLVTTVLMLAMAGGFQPPAPLRRPLLGLGWLLALVLLVVVPEPGLLALVGYAPLLLAGAPFGWPDVDYHEVFTWPLLNQVSVLLGGRGRGGGAAALRAQQVGGAVGDPGARRRGAGAGPARQRRGVDGCLAGDLRDHRRDPHPRPGAALG